MSSADVVLCSQQRKSNLGFQPDESSGLPSLLVDQAGCPFDETGKMAVLRPFQRVFPFKQRRMGVIKGAVERVWGEIAQVFFAQFAQRSNQ